MQADLSLRRVNISEGTFSHVTAKIISSTSRKHAFRRMIPLKPHFYMVKLVFTGVYIIFLFAQNHRLGYSLNRLTEAVLTSTHKICFEQKYEK